MTVTEREEKFEMHPYISQELAKIKIAEELEYAARQRRAREAVSDRPRSIDFSSLGQRLRVRLFGGPALGGKPTAHAGA
jgi:hypothetical protein